MNGQCSCGYRPGRISSIDCRCVTHRELNERLKKIDPEEGFIQKEIDELKATKQDKLIAGANITIEGSMISADLDSTNFYNKIETDELLAEKQGTLTAGENIAISEDNVISADAHMLVTLTPTGTPVGGVTDYTWTSEHTYAELVASLDKVAFKTTEAGSENILVPTELYEALEDSQNVIFGMIPSNDATVPKVTNIELIVRPDGTAKTTEVSSLVQEKLTAGTNITIENGTISADLDATEFYGLRYAPLNVYVDAADGDDENDGLSSSSPKKTINNAIETYGNKGIHPEFRIILKPNTYDFRIFNLTGISLHINTYGSNGTTTVNMINPNTGRFDVAFYSCHVAFNGSADRPLVVNFSNADGLYCDGCHFSATYTTFNGRVATIGCDSTFGDSTIYSLRVARASTSLTDCSVGFIDLESAKLQCYRCNFLTNVDNTTYETNNTNQLINAYNSDLLIFGVTSATYSGLPPMANFCTFNGGRLSLLASLTPSGTLTPFSGNLSIAASVLIGTADRWNGFKQHATTVSVTEDCIKSSTIV